LYHLYDGMSCGREHGLFEPGVQKNSFLIYPS
jgi:hypothetical protein